MRPNGSAWSRSPSGSGGYGPGCRPQPRPGRRSAPRELEVARLVARGLTNKQIGETLYVSERTAENPRPAHPDQARVQQPQPDRRLAGYGCTGRPGGNE
ncbi:MAG TPA: helix-turn-helix transcriptional regulator [Streptosporangiaceae bacterium]|nr:helix-turn-helix transcriptional regulator [Streptosporangiaceae bacterium]